MEEKTHAVRAGTANTLYHCRSMATIKHSTRPSKLGDNLEDGLQLESECQPEVGQEIVIGW